MTKIPMVDADKIVPRCPFCGSDPARVILSIADWPLDPDNKQIVTPFCNNLNCRAPFGSFVIDKKLIDTDLRNAPADIGRIIP